jgi:signal transduction histidine kinase
MSLQDESRDPFEMLRHDLRSPLTVITGFADLLALDRRLTPEQRTDYAKRISAAADEIRRLLDDAAAAQAGR